MKLSFSGRRIEHSGGALEGTHPVIGAAEIEGLVIVIYDYMTFPSGSAARNLFAYKPTGEEVWRAQDIGMGATDAYTSILSENPLVVGNFAGSECTIEVQSGAVLHTAFTK
ncbi:MAG: hypothetical protein ACOY9I_05775 [Pseudomonadota bacterium]|jgi:hypothetical protein